MEKTGARDMSVIAEAKRKLPLKNLLERLGVKTPNKDKFNIRCPIHREQKGNSFSVRLTRGGQQLWKCHGKCQCGGDEITFLEKFENLSKKDAIDPAGGGAGQNVDDESSTDRLVVG